MDKCTEHALDQKREIIFERIRCTEVEGGCSQAALTALGKLERHLQRDGEEHPGPSLAGRIDGRPVLLR